MAQARSKSYCSVPGCFSYAVKHPYLHFHSFPTSVDVREKWVRAIRRDKGGDFVIKKGSTFVCSRHFGPEDYVLGLSVSRLKSDAVPSLFFWNNFTPDTNGKSAYVPCYNRQLVQFFILLESQERAKKATRLDHDYATPYPKRVLHQAVDIVPNFQAKLEHVALPSTIMSRFCTSDAQIRFYTNLPSVSALEIFWEHIAPSASRLTYWSKAKRMGEEAIVDTGPSPSNSIPLINEFLMYSMRTAAGTKEQHLADMFQCSVATVSRLTITWANYLFMILGTVPLWIGREKIRSVMPANFKKHCSNVRVILDCTKVAVAAPSCFTLQSETFTHDKKTTTLKALIGVTPHGFVSFFSKLYTGCISDKEITRISGILQLLEPGDEVIADKDFGIDDHLSDVGVNLVIPPFKRSPQFSKEDAEKTQDIARLRIVVERVIGRIKSNHIWDSPIPLTLIGTVSQIWYNCCVMVNFQGPVSC